jgi:hypothetical protein
LGVACGKFAVKSATVGVWGVTNESAGVSF